MTPARIAFFGTAAVAVPALESLVAAEDFEVVAVVTNPDRAKGRSSTPQPPPVKLAALAHGLAVRQPAKPIELLDELRQWKLDACAIVAYGSILPRALLDAGGLGFVNLHFSLLPRWRGAAPVQHALLAGDATTGVAAFILDEGMDTGPLLRLEETAIGPDETAGDLLDRLALDGAPVLVDALRRLVAGEAGTPQAVDGVTIAGKLHADDAAIDWSRPAEQIVNLIRATNPAPGAHTTFDGKRLKVWRAGLEIDVAAASDKAPEPGSVIVRDRHGVVVATGVGAVRLLEVQPEGKGRMDGAAFGNGHRPDMLGT